MMIPNFADLSQNIKDAKEISDKLEYQIILDCGSLLGAHREGGPIKGDEDDVDFAVPRHVAQHKFLETIEEFKERGFEVFRLRDTVATFKRNGVKVDFLFYDDIRYNGKEYYDLTLYHNKVRHALLTKKKAYDELGEIEYCGTTLPCPADIEDHLEHRYGDWRVPVLRPKFSFQNYIEKGVMIPIQ